MLDDEEKKAKKVAAELGDKVEKAMKELEDEKKAKSKVESEKKS